MGSSAENTREKDPMRAGIETGPNSQAAEPTLYEQRLRETVEDIVVMLEFSRQRGMIIPPDLAASITELLRRPELGGPDLATPSKNRDTEHIDLDDLAAAQS